MLMKTTFETERMARVPGIEFADGTEGRVPRVAGTGIEVFEIVKTCKAACGDMSLLARAYSWLTPPQIEAALAYWRAFPAEIDRRVAEDEACYEDLLTD